MTRLVLLVTLSLLTSVATAYAECAWVLWTEFTEIETGKPSKRLTPTSAFESKTQCDASLSASVSSAAVLARKAFGFQEVTTSEAAVLAGSGGSQGISWVFRCLPDTIDPRGPKR